MQTPLFLALLDGQGADGDSGSAPDSDSDNNEHAGSASGPASPRDLSRNASRDCVDRPGRSDVSESSVDSFTPAMNGAFEPSPDGYTASLNAAASIADLSDADSIEDEAALLLAARTLEMSLEADDDDASSAISRSLDRESLVGLIGAKTARPLKPASTDTARSGPLTRRVIASRNSALDVSDELGADVASASAQLDETALLEAFEAAARTLTAQAADAAAVALGQLRAVAGVQLCAGARARAGGAEPLGAALRLLAAAEGDAALTEAIAALYACWSDCEENAARLCASDGLELLLRLLAARPARARESACAALASLCAFPQGAVALGETRTVSRLCAAVRAARAHALAATHRGADGDGAAALATAATAASSAADDDASAAAAANVLRGLKKLALSSEGRVALAAAGALQLVVETARAHPSAPAVVEQALRTVGNVAIDPEREAAIIEAGCVQLLCAHLASTDAAVLSADTGALANLISNPIVRATIVANSSIRRICEVVSGPLRARADVYKHASWLLTSLIVEHESRAHVLACGGLELLVRHCARDSTQFREEGAWALANLSADVRNALPIVEAGALDVLFELVASGSPSVQLQATWVFANLSVVDQLKPQIGAREGFVRGLYARLEATAPELEKHRPLRLQSIRTLANLAVEASNRARVAEGLSVAIETLLGSANDESTQATLRLMVNLSYDAQIAAAMLREPKLVGALLAFCATPIDAMQQEAVLCIVNLSLDEAAEGVLVAAGALPPLVSILSSHTQVLQEQAAWALSNITTCKESKMAAIELGALHALKGLHRSASGQMRQASTKVMHSLLSMVTPQSRKVFLPTTSNSLRDSHHGRSPLVDGARSTTARVTAGSRLSVGGSSGLSRATVD